ncbi:hypothetical protein LCGC14_0654800 [marine sediment metagenome]|uniref:Uncharacterized protein n=1 Tax=marine sediment metagenome TaxID=412755 RepID=A0A0F9U3H7_9ZZZZ
MSKKMKHRDTTPPLCHISNRSMPTELPKEIRLHGRIATLRRAHKSHRCDECNLLIESGQYYYELVWGGAGLGSLKFPDHVHVDCVHTYIHKYRNTGG